MNKYYCDKCKKEITPWITRIHNSHGVSLITLELCAKHSKELDIELKKIDDQIQKLISKWK